MPVASIILLLVAQSETPRSKDLASVAVMPLQSTGKVSKETTAVLDQLILSALEQSVGKDVRVVGKSDIDAMLGLERLKDAVGCSEVSCAVEVAGALGVDSVITAQIGKLGKRSLLSLSWIHQREARAVARVSQDLGADEEAFDAGVRSAVASLTAQRAQSKGSVAVASDGAFAGFWRWECCGGAWSGWMFFQQSGNKLKGLLTDLVGGSGGELEGYVEGKSARFTRRIRSMKLLQEYNVTLAPDGGGARGDLNGEQVFTMTREPSRPTGAKSEGLTGAWKWQCCDGAWFGTVMLAQQNDAVFGLLHDDRAGSGGVLEGTFAQGVLKFRRTWSRAAGAWQSWELRGSGQKLEGEHWQSDGKPGGRVEMTLSP